MKLREWIERCASERASEDRRVREKRETERERERERAEKGEAGERPLRLILINYKARLVAVV